MFAANGLKFEVAEAGSGDRLALCLHGFPELNFSWRFQMPLLAELGYRVWAPNLRGYGMSSKPDGVEAYAVPKLVGDVAALIDASGAREVLLIGHDWGAALAWAFAIGRVRPLTGLVIMNVPHPACFARELRTWKQLRKSWYMFLFQVPALPEAILGANDGAAIRRAFHGDAIDKSNFTPEVLDVYAGAARRRALTPMINWYRAAARDSFFRAERMDLPVIEVPTLMIWGEADRALDIANTRGTDRFVRDLTLRTLPNVSHWVQQEAVGPVNALLGEWITARLLNPGNAPMR
jgi:pimeloyl-ACP methyl ester carboxylesterase